MKARAAFVVSWAFVLLGVTAGGARAVEPVLTHHLSSYTLGTDDIELDFTLHVLNPSPDEPLRSLVLAFAPVRIAADDLVSVVVDYLAPGESADVLFRLTTGTFIEDSAVQSQVLHWAGAATAADGSTVEFPAESAPVAGGEL